MTPKEIADIITIASRAPLQNMNEAAAVSQLLQKLKNWHAEVTKPVVDKPAPPEKPPSE